MPGLHLAVLEAAERAGIPLALGTRLPWLTGRGHLEPVVQERVAPNVVLALTEMHHCLGGDAQALATKRAGAAPTPDLVHRDTGQIIEVDEVQHFTSARLATLDLYPPNTQLGFDLREYRTVVDQWRTKGDRAFAHKVARDFMQPGGRQAQRAYNDALRDLVAPAFTGRGVIRIAVPDRSLEDAIDRLRSALRLQR